MPHHNIHFDHGFGDVVQFIQSLILWQRRGHTFSVHYHNSGEKNKSHLFEAAGIPYHDKPENLHKWLYHTKFNHPRADVDDGYGNKTFFNLNTRIGSFKPSDRGDYTEHVLPDIGTPEELWQELISIDMENVMRCTHKNAHDVTRFLRGDDWRHFQELPRPIILLHTKGTNYVKDKNIPDDVTRELYRLLLDQTDGSIVLMDWADKMPIVQHSRIKHLNRDWGKIKLRELWAMIEMADLYIGIDSGPWHLTNWTSTPALGVFHNFFPWCVSLPRPSGKNAVLTRDSHASQTVRRRKIWNPIDYPAPMPTAEHIAKSAVRMLSPRYGLPAGRDAMLQHLILDKCGTVNNKGQICDRNNTLDYLFQRLADFDSPRIVETGCIRSREDWSAGYFGYLAGLWVYGAGRGRVTSVDIDPEKCNIARGLLKDWPVEVEQSCSVKWFERQTEPIDVCYLDSMDCQDPRHAEHGLKEIQAADRLIPEGGLVVFDDTFYCGNSKYGSDERWKGKGQLGVPWALNHGYKLVGRGYQAILEKSSERSGLPSETFGLESRYFEKGLTDELDAIRHEAELAQLAEFAAWKAEKMAAEKAALDAQREALKPALELADKIGVNNTGV